MCVCVCTRIPEAWNFFHRFLRPLRTRSDETYFTCLLRVSPRTHIMHIILWTQTRSVNTKLTEQETKRKTSLHTRAKILQRLFLMPLRHKPIYIYMICIHTFPEEELYTIKNRYLIEVRTFFVCFCFLFLFRFFPVNF